MTHRKRRLGYLAAFCVIFAIEVCIALFVRDSFIRPYGGDLLVTVLICCFLRICFRYHLRNGIKPPS